MNAIHDVFAFLIGGAIGSFMNVLIYRLPRDVSIVKPNSFCPKCKKPIRWFENIPILSFIFLGGRCSKCRTSISFQYPAVELLTGLLFLYAFHKYQLSWETFFYLLFFCSLIVISGIDFTHQIIPNVFSMPGILCGLVFQLINQNIVMALIGTVFGGGMILFIRVLGGWAYKKEVMGMGDVYLTAMIGAFLGFPNILIAIFIGAITGSIFGIIYLASTRKHRESPIPFGPFLSLGGMLTVILQTPIISFLNQIGIRI